MGYPQQVEVDTAVLRVVGGAVQASAATLTKAESSSQGRLASSCQDGSAAVAARAAQAAWGAFLVQLAGSVSGLARDFSAAAQHYDAADQAAAGRLGRGGRVPQ